MNGMQDDRPSGQRLLALGGAGILTVEDLAKLDEGVRRVGEFMRDGAWHSAEAVIAASGQREGLRRMRCLREKFTVEKRRVTGTGREWEYRLVGESPRHEFRRLRDQGRINALEAKA